MIKLLEFKPNDGGRLDIGYKKSGDCVVRALAIAEDIQYEQARKIVASFIDECASSKKKTGRHGVPKETTTSIFISRGYTYVEPTGMFFRSRQGLPTKGRIIVRVKSHVVAVVNNVVNDSWNSQKKGRVKVRGYFIKNKAI